MKDPLLYIIHIHESLKKIVEYTREGREAFLADPKTQGAASSRDRKCSRKSRGWKPLLQGYQKVNFSPVRSIHKKTRDILFEADLTYVRPPGNDPDHFLQYIRKRPSSAN